LNNDVATTVLTKSAMDVPWISKERSLKNRDSTCLIVLLQKKTILMKKIYAILAFALRESYKKVSMKMK
jgi:hypothetical protein